MHLKKTASISKKSALSSFFLISILICIFTISADTNYENDSIVHVAFFTKLYVEPFTDAPLVSIIGDTATLALLEIRDQWYKVQYEAHTGWVQRNAIYNDIKREIEETELVKVAPPIKSTTPVHLQIHSAWLIKAILIASILSGFIAIMRYRNHRTLKEKAAKIMLSKKHLQNQPLRFPSNYQVNGTIHEFSLHDILQMLETTSKTGILSVEDPIDNVTGRLHLTRGIITFAEVNFMEGRKAIYHALSITRGSFRFIATPNSQILPGNCNFHPTTILLEFAKQQDEQLYNNSCLVI